jgi:hypothetical protein
MPARERLEIVEKKSGRREMISSSSLSLKHYLCNIRYFIGPVGQLESAWAVFVE